MKPLKREIIEAALLCKTIEIELKDGSINQIVKFKHGMGSILHIDECEKMLLLANNDFNTCIMLGEYDGNMKYKEQYMSQLDVIKIKIDGQLIFAQKNK